VFNVLLVDDHLMLLEGVRLAFEAQDDVSDVEVASSAEAAITRFRASSPDVAIVDYRIGSDSGADLTRALLALDPDATIVVVSALTSPLVVDDCVDAGCVAFVQKQKGINELLSIVPSAMSGMTHFPRRQRSPQGLVAAPGTGSLSTRELEILQLLSEGLPPKTIAERLVISVHTVRNHIGEIRRKLGVTNQLAAVARASSAGIIAGPGAGA
jgi:DNA-binding NarL/FixJ family response regulator